MLAATLLAFQVCGPIKNNDNYEILSLLGAGGMGVRNLWMFTALVEP
jgi:hypothetical protein